MTVEELEEFFEEQGGVFHMFEDVTNPLNALADINGLLLLQRLSPGQPYAIAGADHDIVYLSADAEVVAENATEEDLLNLMRSGIHYSQDTECFITFA